MSVFVRLILLMATVGANTENHKHRMRASRPFGRLISTISSARTMSPILMVLLKVARITGETFNADNYVYVAGYAESRQSLPPMPMLDELPFNEVWCVDFEFSMKAGERPDPVCLVAWELRSGRKLRLWRDEFGLAPPYSTGPDVLFVAYYASAEIGCHLALGWPKPSASWICSQSSGAGRMASPPQPGLVFSVRFLPMAWTVWMRPRRTPCAIWCCVAAGPN